MHNLKRNLQVMCQMIADLFLEQSGLRRIIQCDQPQQTLPVIADDKSASMPLDQLR
ncbi:hypothetical protein D3C75_1211320 [compost metagenome]